MRKYTLLFSIVFHAAIVGAAFVVPIVATDALPAPLRSTSFVMVTPRAPSVRPPAVRRTQPDAPSLEAAPIEAPPAIAPEIPRPLYSEPDAGRLPDLDNGVAGGELSDPRAESPPLPPAPKPELPRRVGGVIKPPQRIHEVAARYPEIARAAGIRGIVILEAVITKDGTVGDVKVLRSIPLLDQAAVEAVRQWRFTPTLLNGEPIPLVMTVTVNFELN